MLGGIMRAAQTSVFALAITITTLCPQLQIVLSIKPNEFHSISPHADALLGTRPRRQR